MGVKGNLSADCNFGGLFLLPRCGHGQTVGGLLLIKTPLMSQRRLVINLLITSTFYEMATYTFCES